MTCILYSLAGFASALATVFVCAALRLARDVDDHERNH